MIHVIFEEDFEKVKLNEPSTFDCSVLSVVKTLLDFCIRGVVSQRVAKTTPIIIQPLLTPTEHYKQPFNVMT